MSRFSVFMIILPCCLLHIYRRDYLLSIFGLAVLLPSATVIGLARELAIEFDIFSRVGGGSLLDLGGILINNISNLSFDPIIVANLLSRFGGGQDVVLASQYSIEVTGGLGANLSRIFLGSLETASLASWHLYDFVPPTGQGVGYGQLAAQLIQVNQASQLLGVSVIILFSIYLRVFDVLIARIGILFDDAVICYILVLPLVLLLILYSSFYWSFWYFALLLAIVFCSKYFERQT